VQAYQDSLAGLATASQARRLSSVKSLLSFGHKTGYLAVNVGAPIRLPKIKQRLAERILSEDDVLQMLALERQPRATGRSCGCSTSAACASPSSAA
jgi:site-specific recombinase XerD